MKDESSFTIIIKQWERVMRGDTGKELHGREREMEKQQERTDRRTDRPVIMRSCYLRNKNDERVLKNNATNIRRPWRTKHSLASLLKLLNTARVPP